MNPIKVAVVALTVALVSTAVMGGGAAQSATNGDDQPEKEVRIVDEEIVVADGILTIADTTLKGPGLGEQTIEDSEYTVNSTLRFDGFHVTHGDTLYTFCRVTITIEDVGVRLQNVTLTEGGEAEPDEAAPEPTETGDEPTEDEPTETTETPTPSDDDEATESDEHTEDCGCVHVGSEVRASG